MIYLTNTEILQQLSATHTKRVPITRKEKLDHLPTGFFLPPFILFIAFLSRIDNNASLHPILIAIPVGVAWYLLFMVAHRVISKEQFANLTTEEQQQRLLYDSIWYYLLRTGLGFYCVFGLVWGMVEFGITKGQMDAAMFLLAVDLVLVVVSVVNWRWIAIVKMEGYRKHKRTGTIVGIVFGLFAALPMFSGLASVIRVTWSQESKALLEIPFMVLLNLFPMVIFVMTLLGILITIAHYKRWRLSRVNTV